MGKRRGFPRKAKFWPTGTGVIRLVEARTVRELAHLEDPYQARASYSIFGLDGTRLVTTNSESGSIHIWDLRLIRRHLAALGLDWDAPPLMAGSPRAFAAPLQVTVDLDIRGLPNLAENQTSESFVRRCAGWLSEHHHDGEG